MFFVQQTTQTDCGFTVVKMLLANLNKDENYLYLSSPFHKDKDVSLFDLIIEAKKYSLILKASRTNDKYSLSKNEQVPFIPILNIEGRNHAVYLYKIKDKYVYYYDPVGEFVKKKKEEFIALWTGDFLRVEVYESLKAPVKKPLLVKPIERAVSISFTFISALCSVLGVYFINKNSYFFLPAIFLSLMIIVEIILKRYSISIMKKMDMRINCYFDDIKDNEYMLYHRYYEEYKSSLLVNDINFFASFGIVIIIAIILLLNDKINAIYLGVNIFLSCIMTFVISPRMNKKELKMENKEALLGVTKDKSEALKNINELRKEAYIFGNNLNIIKYFFIFIQILTAFIMMMYMNLVNVTYIICYTVLEIYFYQHLTSILNSYDKKERNNYTLVKLLALFEKNS